MKSLFKISAVLALSLAVVSASAETISFQYFADIPVNEGPNFEKVDIDLFNSSLGTLRQAEINIHSQTTFTVVVASTGVTGSEIYLNQDFSGFVGPQTFLVESPNQGFDHIIRFADPILPGQSQIHVDNYEADLNFTIAPSDPYYPQAGVSESGYYYNSPRMVGNLNNLISSNVLGNTPAYLELFQTVRFNGNGLSFPGYPDSNNFINGTRSRIDLIYTYDVVDPASVPEPTTLSLLALGLAGLGFARYRKRV